MYGELSWYSQSRIALASIAVNGGGVCYDRLGAGFRKVPEEKRLAVLHMLQGIDSQLEELFKGDANVRVQA